MSSEWSVLILSVSLVGALHLSLALFFTYTQNTAANNSFKVGNVSLLFGIVSSYSILVLAFYEKVIANNFVPGFYTALCLLGLLICKANNFTKILSLLFVVFCCFFLLNLFSHSFSLEVPKVLFETMATSITLVVILMVYIYLSISELELWVILVLTGLLTYYLISTLSISIGFIAQENLFPLFMLTSVVALVQILVIIKLHLSKATELRLHRLVPDLAQVGILVLDSSNNVIYKNSYFQEAFKLDKQAGLINQFTNEITIINSKIAQGDKWSSILKTGTSGEEEYTCVTSSTMFDEVSQSALRAVTLVDITEQTHYKKVLEESGKKFSKLSNRILSNHEIERAKISRELHDDIAQQLTLLKFTTAFLERESVRVQIESEVEGVLESVRVMSRQLRPAVMDELGFQKALDGLVKSTDLKGGTVQYQFNNQGFVLKHPIDINLYRIISEYLTVTIKEGNATEISLWITGDTEKLILMVEDNAGSLDLNRTVSRSNEISQEGLLTMKERVRLLNGRMDVKFVTDLGNVMKIEIDSDR